MRRINQVRMPKRGARRGVCIESVETFVLRGHDNDIVLYRRDRYLGNPEWLGIDGAVGWAGEQLAEGGSIDGRSGESELASVRAVTRKIVVISEDSREIRNRDEKRGRNGRVGDTCGGDCINAGDGWSSVRCYRTRRREAECTASRPGTTGAASGPVHAAGVIRRSGKGQGLCNSERSARGRNRNGDPGSNNGESEVDGLVLGPGIGHLEGQQSAVHGGGRRACDRTGGSIQRETGWECAARDCPAVRSRPAAGREYCTVSRSHLPAR